MTGAIIVPDPPAEDDVRRVAILERARDFLCVSRHRGLDIVKIIDARNGVFLFRCTECGKEGTTLRASYWNPRDDDGGGA